MSTRTTKATKSPQEQLAELIEANPALVAVLREAFGGEAAEAAEYPTEWEAETDEHRDSKSKQSQKYEAFGFAEDSEGVSHKVILVAYVPNELAKPKARFEFKLEG